MLANLTSDLAALYERVRRSIKSVPGISRTEAFLKWAEAHPSEVLAATDHPADVAVRELEAAMAAASRRLNPYEERKAARLERMRAKAARLESAAEGAHASAREIADRIPMGQPILVGHHSERRHRRDIDRIQRGFGKAAELHKDAERLRRRAARSEASDAVSSDDPDAIPRLREKLASVERDRGRMVAANKAVRSKNPRQALAALGFSDAMVDRALTADFAGRLGFPDYALRNAAAEASRLRKRLAELEARATRPTAAPLEVGGARIEEADNRVRIVFERKPEEAVRTALKKAGFRWSPTTGAWQRHASSGAWYEAKRLLGATVGSEDPAPSTKPANHNALTAGGRHPDEVARLQALEAGRSRRSVKGEGLDTTQIAAAIRADIKEAVRAGELPKGHYSVTTSKYSMGSSVTVVASKMPFEVLNPDAFVVEPGANWVTFDRSRHRSRLTPEAEAVERALNAIVDAYHWDRSDSMTDHYNERFAKHVEVKENDGAWRKLELAKVAAARAVEERV